MKLLLLSKLDLPTRKLRQTQIVSEGGGGPQREGGGTAGGEGEGPDQRTGWCPRTTKGRSPFGFWSRKSPHQQTDDPEDPKKKKGRFVGKEREKSHWGRGGPFLGKRPDIREGIMTPPEAGRNKRQRTGKEKKNPTKA